MEKSNHEIRSTNICGRWHRNFVKLKEENNLTLFFEDFRNYLDMLLRRKVFEFWVGYRYPEFEFDEKENFLISLDYRFLAFDMKEVSLFRYCFHVESVLNVYQEILMRYWNFLCAREVDEKF